MTVSANPAGPSPAQVWSTGDYADVCDRMIPDLGARLVELSQVASADEVLDVAAGSGNASLPAARRGAKVTALDITPALLEVGRRRAAAEGLEITWVEGDAQAMPFADAGFDVVLSCVGVQFCADRGAAIKELVRVCRPGGRIALIAWTPEGFIGQVLAAITSAMTGGPRPGSLDWGSEDWITETFAELANEISFSRAQVAMPAPSAAAWVDYMATAYGPMAMARTALEARGDWEPAREALIRIAGAHEAGDGDGFSAEAEYLVAIVSR
ncbi:MAG TPA: class I SAM-dependent methyltransferase [Solirubrobacteraceae bacterium]|nr:class I SAM-dependent methyltransferase [Solirubrobacteraceae bacterium]